MIARALAGLALLLALSARAQAEVSVEHTLDESDRRYADLDYRGAAELAEAAAHELSATPAEQLRAWERVGLSWLVLRQPRVAREAFDHLFTLDPRHVVVDPSLSPRDQAFIEDVRAKHPPPAVIEPHHDTPQVVVVPPVVQTTKPPRRPVWKRWYLWTPIAIGVAVGVGLGVGLGIGLNRQVPNGSLGAVNLGLRF